MAKILIVSDAESPQINGVVVTIENVVKQLENMGHTVLLICPHMFRTIPLPTYPEIKVALNPWKMKKHIEKFNPDYIHVATEGTLGFYATYYCRKMGYKFTTSFHTKMAEYVNQRFPLMSVNMGYKILKKLHKGSSCVLVTNNAMKNELSEKGFENLKIWSRGVDHDLFNPVKRRRSDKKLVFLNVGRVVKDKNLEEFLDLGLPGYKVVIGDGPDLRNLKAQYAKDTSVFFLGPKNGEELARHYANADVFVFPSKSDTFGIVMLEACASGTPVAAYPVTGPSDFIENGVNGYMDKNLLVACMKSVNIPRSIVHEHSLKYSWRSTAEIFFESLVKIDET